MITEGPDHGDDAAKRWVTLGVLLLATVIVILDNTVLSVALPALMRDFDATLPSLQWVLSGYALTFATFLIIGGKMADLYGPRRMFVVGLAIFAIGSYLASISQTTGQMIFGEAIVEGFGASLLLPAATGILTNTFQGAERPKAFAAWGAAVGAGAAFGPVLGGYLTTYHSWRWAFRINVVLAPIAAIVALSVMRRDGPIRRARFDLVGAALVALGSFALVFGISQGPTYGWWESLAGLTVNGTDLWPADRSVSIIPLVLVVSAALLAALFVFERRRERLGGEALFPLSQLRHRGFRNGILTALVFTAGSMGFMFVMAVFLQQTRRLSAMSTGSWLIPYGISVLLGAQLAGRLTRSYGPVRVVRVGTLISFAGTVALALSVSPSVDFLALVPAMVIAGFGAGFVNTQLSSLILVDIDPGYGSVAGATASTVRQLGSAIGIAGIGAAFSASGARTALLVASGALLASIVTAYLLPRHIGHHVSEADDDQPVDLLAVEVP